VIHLRSRRLDPLLVLVLPGIPLLGCPDRAPPVSGAPGPAPAPAPGPPPPARQGSIEGSIRFLGPVPPPLKVSIPADLARFCGQALEQPQAVVGEGGGLSEVVAWVAGARGPLSAAPAPPPLDQRGCAFHPRVVAAAEGGQLTVINSDPLLHNVRTASPTDRPANVAMPITGMKVQIPLAATPAVVRLTCDVHPWMVAHVRTFDHPYFAVSGADGRFAIRGAPAGKQVLQLWHPSLGEHQVEVEVPEGGVARPQIDWPAR